MAAPAFRVRRIQPLAAAMPPATRHVPAWQPLTAPHRVNGISVNQRMRSLDLPRDAGAVYRKRAGIVSRHHDDTMTRDETRAKNCKKYLILLNKFAGVVQWQNGSFPSCIRGFDSLRPLQPLSTFSPIWFCRWFCQLCSLTFSMKSHRCCFPISWLQIDQTFALAA